MRKGISFLPFFFAINLLFGQFDAADWPAFPYDPQSPWYHTQPSIRKPVGVARLYPTKYPPEADTFKPKTLYAVLQETSIPWINVSQASYDQSETWIAINPQNPMNLVAGANDGRGMRFGGPYRMYAYYSTDGGRTWAESPLSTVADVFIDVPYHATNFDPCIAFNSKGWAYYSFGFTQVAQQSGEFEDNGVFVCRSTDNGATWQLLDPVTLNIDNGPFDDKYLMTIDTVSQSPYRDNIYIVWTRFGSGSGIYFSKSTDDGESWSPPRALITSGGFQSPIPVVGPNGEIYVFWRSQSSNQTQAVCRISTDGGETWSSPRIAQTVYTTGQRHSQSNRYVLPDKQNIRVSSYPAAAVDFSNKYPGRIYVVQSGKMEFDGPEGIYLTYSDDRGNTWALPRKIDNNTLGTDVFFPAIAVDPKTGTVGVLYYSSEYDPNNRGVDAILALSSDGGQTFRHFRLTPYTAYIEDPQDISYQGQAGNYYWGDYTGIAAVDGIFYPCYWFPDPSGGFAYYTLDVYINVVSLGPKPVEQLTAIPSIDQPNIITLHWQDPSENLIGDPLNDFVVFISRYDFQSQETQLLAQVPAGIEQYIDSTAINGRRYAYNVWVVTDDGFQSAIRSVGVVAGGALEPFPPSQLIAKPHTNGVLLQWRNPQYHIDSTEFYDFYAVRIYGYNPQSDSTWLIEELTTSQLQLQAGTKSEYIINVPLERFYWFRITAVGKRDTVHTESAMTPAAFSYAGAPLMQFSEAFDSPTVTPYYTNGKWGITSIKAFSPPNCLTDSPDGEYDRRESSEIIFAPFVVDGSNTTLSFAHISLIDPVGDIGMVYISQDFGQSWIPLMGTNRDRAPDKFVGSIDSADWIEEHRDLSPYIGDTLYLRFLLLTNAIRSDDGWYIDDIRIDNATTVRDVYAASFSATISPLPVTDYLFLKYLLAIPSTVTATLYDALGKTVLQEQLGYSTAGEYSAAIDLSHLPTGVYLLVVQTQYGSKHFRIPVVH